MTRTGPTPAPALLADLVSDPDLNLGLVLTHLWTPAGDVHSARLSSIGPFQLDGKFTDELPEDDPDYEREEVEGHGASPTEARFDLLRIAARLTWGLVQQMRWEDPPAGVPEARAFTVAYDPATRSVRPTAEAQWRTVYDLSTGSTEPAPDVPGGFCCAAVYPKPCQHHGETFVPSGG